MSFELRTETLNSKLSTLNFLICFFPEETDEESLSVDDGEIILKLSSASFLIKKPQIKVIGFINFSMVSLPFIQEVWIRNAKLIGNVTFCIDYNDETYFFSDGIIGTYNTDVPLQYPKIEDNIPWKDIIMSPYHILTVILIINFVFYKSKRAKYIQIK